MKKKGNSSTQLGLYKYNHKIECNICKKNVSKQYMKRHRAIHKRTRPYKCEICGKGFSLEGYLLIHSLVHSGLKPYACQICNASFSRHHSLTTHMRLHTGFKPYKCGICGKGFVQRSPIVKHAECNHSEVKKIKNKEGKWKYVSNSNMYDLIQVQQKGKCHICSICGQSFTQKNDLLKHQNIHKKNVSQECKMCKMSFPSVNQLMQHSISHQKLAIATEITKRGNLKSKVNSSKTTKKGKTKTNVSSSKTTKKANHTSTVISSKKIIKANTKANISSKMTKKANSESKVVSSKMAKIVNPKPKIISSKVTKRVKPATKGNSATIAEKINTKSKVIPSKLTKKADRQARPMEICNSLFGRKNRQGKKVPKIKDSSIEAKQRQSLLNLPNEACQSSNSRETSSSEQVLLKNKRKDFKDFLGFPSEITPAQLVQKHFIETYQSSNIRKSQSSVLTVLLNEIPTEKNSRQVDAHLPKNVEERALLTTTSMDMEIQDCPSEAMARQSDQTLPFVPCQTSNKRKSRSSGDMLLKNEVSSDTKLLDEYAQLSKKVKEGEFEANTCLWNKEITKDKAVSSHKLSPVKQVFAAEDENLSYKIKQTPLEEKALQVIPDSCNVSKSSLLKLKQCKRTQKSIHLKGQKSLKEIPVSTPKRKSQRPRLHVCRICNMSCMTESSLMKHFENHPFLNTSISSSSGEMPLTNEISMSTKGDEQPHEEMDSIETNTSIIDKEITRENKVSSHKINLVKQLQAKEDKDLSLIAKETLQIFSDSSIKSDLLNEYSKETKDLCVGNNSPLNDRKCLQEIQVSPLDRSIHSSKLHACKICGKNYTLQTSLIRHLRTHQDPKAKNLINHSIDQYYKPDCNPSDKVNTKRSSIENIEEHEEKVQKCNICDKVFINSSALNKHLPSHNTLTAHICKVCGKGFILEHFLRTHSLEHKGVIP